MSKLEFKAEPFQEVLVELVGTLDHKYTAEQLKEVAQAIYDNYRKTLPKVNGTPEHGIWLKDGYYGLNTKTGQTHTALLDAMEKLK